MERLVYLHGSDEIPLLLKSGPPLLSCPADVPWRDKYETALEPLKKGQWQAAADRLTALSAELPDAPAVWDNLAVVRSWLADDATASEAYFKFASLDVPLDDAVEATAMGMLLHESPLGDDIDVVRWNWPVTDHQRLQEALLSDGRVVVLPVDAAQWPDAEGPPPRMAGMLLDRSLPSRGEAPSLETLPHVLGQLLLFGRETDRAARLVIFRLNRTDADLAAVEIRQIGGDTLEPAPEETVMGKVSASRQLISPGWVQPRGASRSQMAPLMLENLRKLLLNDWPDLPLGILGGRSLRQAAGDPSARVKVLAVILVAQQWVEQDHASFDFNELRSQLGLPTLGPIEPQAGELAALPLVRFDRIRPESLSDDDLVTALQRTAHFHYWEAARKFARAVLGRPSLPRGPERMEAFHVLVQSATALEEGIAVIDEARRDALSQGQSCAAWDLQELAFRFSHAADISQTMELMQHIESRHINEKGVAQALTQMLINVGLLNADGTPVAATAHSEAAAPAAEPSKLWTPGSESAGSGGKLWTPGS